MPDPFEEALTERQCQEDINKHFLALKIHHEERIDALEAQLAELLVRMKEQEPYAP